MTNKDTYLFQTAVRGRNTKHCSLYGLCEFTHRFNLIVINLITFAYLALFIKIYFANEMVSYTTISPFSMGPFILVYTYELLLEVFSQSRAWQLKN